MDTAPDLRVLYPDVLSRGSLAAALATAAAELSLTFPVMSSTAHALDAASIASGVEHRNALRVNARVRERRWSIWGTESFQDLPLIDGSTDDLAEIARAAHAWHSGAALEEIRRVAPFVHLTGRFEVPDRDPVRLTASEWEHLRTEARELETDWAPAYHALIEAAYAVPALRRLYPFTSHWALRFATSAGREIADAVGPIVVTQSTGRYSVRAGIATDESLAEAVSAADAVAAAMCFMPASIANLV